MRNTQILLAKTIGNKYRFAVIRTPDGFYDINEMSGGRISAGHTGINQSGLVEAIANIIMWSAEDNINYHPVINRLEPELRKQLVHVLTDGDGAGGVKFNKVYEGNPGEWGETRV